MMTSPLRSPGSWHCTVVGTDSLIRYRPVLANGLSFHPMLACAFPYSKKVTIDLIDDHEL